MGMDWMASVIDWDTCKIQHEVLGDSLERVSQTHNVSLTSLQRVAEEENWSRTPPAPEEQKAYLQEVISVHKTKLSLATLYRDMELFPRLINAENMLLEKITSAISLVDLNDPRAPGMLRALGQGLNAISERKILSQVTDEAIDETDMEWTVAIKKSETALTVVKEQLRETDEAEVIKN